MHYLNGEEWPKMQKQCLNFLIYTILSIQKFGSLRTNRDGYSANLQNDEYQINAKKPVNSLRPSDAYMRR